MGLAATTLGMRCHANCQWGIKVLLLRHDVGARMHSAADGGVR